MKAEKRVRPEIGEIVQKLVAEYAPQLIVLFGSYAGGKPTPDSDIDLLIVKETDHPPMRRWMEVKRLLRDRRRTASVSPLVYTPKELQERLALQDFFVQDVLEHGVVLYGNA
ncbi:MAG: nucleotidyltransferase domain-containing protein [Planctomycetota bacterium]